MTLLPSLTAPLAGAALFLAASLSAQATWVSSVGTGQAVPDPWNPAWPAGQLCLDGIHCPLAALQLSFELTGMPVGYSAGPVNYEICGFVLDLGASSLPGIPLLGGVVYVPLLVPYVFLAGPSLYIGPSDIVCSGGSGIGCGTPSPTRNGARFRFFRPPGTFGALTVQGFVLDPVLNRLFTSNAVNFTLP